MPDNTFYPSLVRHLCAATDLQNARQHTRLHRSCSTSMCCGRLRECPTTHFTPILFDIYVLRETQRMPENTFYPNLVRHLCAAKDSENARKHILPQSCSTSMSCERPRRRPTTHAFTLILFDIYVLRETQRMPDATFCSTPMRCERLENARKHILLRSFSTCMCCERRRECPKTHFTPILFDVYVLRETSRMPENTFYPNLARHLCAARDLQNARQHTRLPQSCSTSMCGERFREYQKTHFTPIFFDIYVL